MLPRCEIGQIVFHEKSWMKPGKSSLIAEVFKMNARSVASFLRRSSPPAGLNWSGRRETYSK